MIFAKNKNLEEEVIALPCFVFFFFLKALVSYVKSEIVSRIQCQVSGARLRQKEL